MLNKDALKTHQYNVAIWLQNINSQIKKQRELCARLFVRIEREEFSISLEKIYKTEYTKLENLYKSRNKLREEEKKLCSENEQNKAMK